jgi:peroxiredoxin
VLQDMNGDWIRLSNFKSKVVLLTFWAAWSSSSKRQVRELVGLQSQYRDRGLVVIGISVNEGGAERIRSFVESSNLNYTILIADTAVKTAYGGIGKLPTNFIIDQEGNIYKEYTEYKGRHILELDIGKLLPSD